MPVSLHNDGVCWWRCQMMMLGDDDVRWRRCRVTTMSDDDDVTWWWCHMMVMSHDEDDIVEAVKVPGIFAAPSWQYESTETKLCILRQIILNYLPDFKISRFCSNKGRILNCDDDFIRLLNFASKADVKRSHINSLLPLFVLPHDGIEIPKVRNTFECFNL